MAQLIRKNECWDAARWVEWRGWVKIVKRWHLATRLATAGLRLQSLQIVRRIKNKKYLRSKCWPLWSIPRIKRTGNIKRKSRQQIRRRNR